MIQRSAEHLIQELAKGYPVIAITGPRQSGKTTLARSLFPEKDYISLENLDEREFAEKDPRGFLERYDKGAIFDEVQRVPHLFSYLQEVIDGNPSPARFVLTGSQQFGLQSGISQSLAGRVGMVQLLPFSIYELYSTRKILDGVDLKELLFTGLYPPIHDRNLQATLWHSNYVQTYIERDLRQMIQIRDLSLFQRFIRLCAGRIGQLLNLSSLASDCGITHNTAKAWISILEASYIIYLLQPHHRNFNKRLIKTPKLYFHDSGLAAWLLEIHSSNQLEFHPQRGSLFEGLMVSEQLKARYNLGFPGSLYFWRDRSGNEVDLLIDKGLGLQAIEIKSGQTLNSDYFKGIKKWVELAGKEALPPKLLYGGRESRKQSGVDVYSWRNPDWLIL